MLRKLEYEEILAERLTEESALTVERHPVVGVLEDIRSLYNVGSCFRTADALLLERLILTGYTPLPPRKEISKTALGAERSVPWEGIANPTEVVEKLRGEGYAIWGLELVEGAASLDQLAEIPPRVALLAGNEISGIRSETLALCDQAISIPMYGVKHSLNVAVSFGIAMWELVRRVREQDAVDSR